MQFQIIYFRKKTFIIKYILIKKNSIPLYMDSKWNWIYIYKCINQISNDIHENSNIKL